MTTTTLNRYYEDELFRLRELAAEFGRAHPLLAPMLGAPSGDPDVERLLEGVAFLTGLARQKLDDGLPELVQGLANLLFPHSLRPVPAATLIAFEPRGALRERAVVGAGTEIESTPVDGTACRFRTCVDLDVEPIALADCRFVPSAGDVSALRLDFEMLGIDASEWDATRIRLFVGGERLHASRLFTLLMRHVVSVDITCGPPRIAPARASHLAAARCGRRASTTCCCPAPTARFRASGCCTNTSRSPRNSCSSN